MQLCLEICCVHATLQLELDALCVDEEARWARDRITWQSLDALSLGGNARGLKCNKSCCVIYSLSSIYVPFGVHLRLDRGPGPGQRCVFLRLPKCRRQLWHRHTGLGDFETGESHAFLGIHSRHVLFFQKCWLFKMSNLKSWNGPGSSFRMSKNPGVGKSNIRQIQVVGPHSARVTLFVWP